MAITAEGAQAQAGRPQLGLRRFVAALMLAFWVASVVPAWQSTWHIVNERSFAADVAAGRVVAFSPVGNVRDNVFLWGVATAPFYDLPDWDPATGEVLRDDTGGIGFTEGYASSPLGDGVIYTVAGGTRVRYLSDEAATSVAGTPLRLLLDAGVQPFDESTEPPLRDWAVYPALAMYLVFLIALFSFQPRRGTRPFWFFVAAVPLGLGMLAYAGTVLLARAPALAPAPTAPVGAYDTDPSKPRRARWWKGVLIMVVGAFLVPAVWKLVI